MTESNTSNKPECSFDPCSKEAKEVGLCRAYRRQQRAGKPLKKLRIYLKNATPLERLAAHSEEQGECRVWTGSTVPHPSRSGKDAGQIRVDGKLWLAHRLSYTLNIGPIPEGFQVDHKCRNPPCINPNHLQLATNKVNNENLSGARINSKTGIRGVTWFKPMKKYRATVGHNGKQYIGGYFDDIKEAEQAAIALRKKLFTNSLKDYEVKDA